jgi:antitoxin (DNA-binding transcriptional repressor) of toxin-antitoxin stability system
LRYILLEQYENRHRSRIAQSLHQLLEWIDAGEEIRITRRGIVIARLIPENRARAQPGVDWIKSAAFALERLNLRPLKAEQTEKLLDDNKGPF